jgi:two-component system response regulator WspF
MRVAIVNDLPIAVEILRRTLALAPEHSVAWVAGDGRQAVERCREDTPDVVLMDLIMPVMDGVEATRRIMRESPCAVLVVTATVEGNAALVFEAMGHGALDAVCTPVLDGGALAGSRELLAKLTTLSALLGRNGPSAEPLPPFGPSAAPRPVPPLVALGCSTGGPMALGEILRSLPDDFPAPLVLVQHVDARFVQGLADWLDGHTGLTVRLARQGDRPAPGLVLLAGGDRHLVMEKDGTLGYSEEPRDTPYRPSVDVFFSSLARSGYPRSVAGLLTGMGRDGARGLLELKQKGWFTLAQDEATCVVHGMPKAALELGAAIQVLALEDIAPALVRHFHHQRLARL